MPPAPENGETAAAAPEAPAAPQGHPRPYRVGTQWYQPIPDADGFRQRGTASWYGKKFHGRKTSNGETYDMYAMTAAHKTLPLPSYVKVTNLANDKTVIVRVNDRGPFHDNRIIDLSYAAAHRLDMLKTGTAKVKLEVIYIENPESVALAALKNTKLHYVQVIASSDKGRIDHLAQTLADQYQVKTRIQQNGNLYRLQLGPIGRQQIAAQLHQTLQQNGYPQSYLVTE